ncbi:hypothetical protein BHM03_00050578, partial [Ensete ventricosum]
DRSKEVVASLSEGNVIPRFSSSAMFDKDEGRGLRRLSVKKKLSRHLAVRGRRRPEVLPLLLPLSLSSSFYLGASSSLVAARLIPPGSKP